PSARLKSSGSWRPGSGTWCSRPCQWTSCTSSPSSSPLPERSFRGCVPLASPSSHEEGTSQMASHPSRLRVLLPSVALLLLVPTGTLAQARHKLTQAGFRVLYMAPAFIGAEKGFFSQEGVDFTFTELDSGALGAAAVISGNAQISDLDPLGVARLQQEGKSMLLMYNLVGRVTRDLVVRTPVAHRRRLTADTQPPTRYLALTDR